MRLIPVVLTFLLAVLTPVSSFAASTISVRAIAFTASNERGATDPQLAPYEATLRSNLRFESFHYVGENSTTVSPGGTGKLSVPGGGQLQLQCDPAGNVRVQRGETSVTVARGRPAVFMGGRSAKGGVSGVIVLLF